MGKFIFHSKNVLLNGIIFTHELSHNNYLWHTCLRILGIVGGEGGGGGWIHPHIFFCQEWIFNKLFTVWKHKNVLLLLNG